MSCKHLFFGYARCHSAAHLLGVRILYPLIIQLIIVKGLIASTVFSQTFDPQQIFEKGYQLYKKGEYSQAITYFLRADSMTENNSSNTIHFYCAYYLGLCYRSLNQNASAEHHFLRSLNLLENYTQDEKTKLSETIHHVYMYLGELAYRQKNLQSALQYFQTSLQSYRSLSNPTDSILFNKMYNIAILLKEANKVIEAIQMLEKAKEYLKDRSNQEKYNYYLLLSDLYQKTGQRGKRDICNQRISEILDRSTELMDNQKELELNEIINDASRDPNSALIQLERLLVELKKNNLFRLLAKGYQIKGVILSQLKNEARAISAFDSSLIYCKEDSDFNIAVETNLHMGRLFLMRGEFNKSLHHFRAAQQILNGSDWHPLSWYVFYGLAKCFSRLFQPDSTNFYFEKAISVIENYSSSIADESYRFKFLQEKLSVYDDFISFLVLQLKDYSKAFTLVQQSKARRLSELLQHSEKDGRFSSDLNRSNGYVSLEELQVQLSPQMGYVEYYITPTRTFVWYVAPDTLLFRIVHLSESTLKTGIHKLLASLIRKERNTKQFCKTFYDSLFIHLPHYPATIYLSPHKDLHKLPFQVLYDGEKYLVEKTNIINIPGANLFYYYKTNHITSSSKQNYSFACSTFPGFDRLKYVQEEADTVAYYLGNTITFLENQATESNLKKIDQFNILHLSCHSFFDFNNPLQSFLALKPDQLNDGRITVKEIFNKKFNGNTVVLSACQTALGEVKAGDEIIGFTRAFMMAGTPLIVASLWEIDDVSTFYIMSTFYRYLTYYNYPVSEALRQAQLNLLQHKMVGETYGEKLTSTYDEPYYWAAFKITGFDYSLESE